MPHMLTTEFEDPAATELRRVIDKALSQNREAQIDPTSLRAYVRDDSILTEKNLADAQDVLSWMDDNSHTLRVPTYKLEALEILFAMASEHWYLFSAEYYGDISYDADTIHQVISSTILDDSIKAVVQAGEGTTLVPLLAQEPAPQALELSVAEQEAYKLVDGTDLWTFLDDPVVQVREWLIRQAAEREAEAGDA